MVIRSTAALSRRHKNGILRAAAASVVFLAALPLTLSAQLSFAEFNVASGPNSNPQGICTGPDGAIWFVETSINAGNAKIGRITVNGAFTEYALPAGSEPQQIVAGPDGNLYFTAGSGGSNFIGQIVPSTGVITQDTIPTANASPTGITVGADGNIWFAEAAPGVHAIAAVSTSGNFNVVTPIVLPIGNSIPTWLTVGPDNNIWFTEQGVGKIGTIRNGSLTEYTINSGNSQPFAIASDGTDLWFTDRLNNQIWEITTTGTATARATLASGADPLGITKGPDGAMWFTEGGASKIGRITTNTFAETDYNIPTGNAGPYGIVVGPDGALWFSETIAGNIGRVSEISFESFANVSGALTNIAIGADGSVFGLNSGGYLYTYNGTQFTSIPGNLSTSPGSFSVGSASAVWGINSQSNIYHLDYSNHTPNWTQIPGHLVSISAGADGEVWGLNSDSNIFHYDAAAGVFVQVQGALAQITVGSAGAVYGVNSAGNVFWYNPGANAFQQVGTQSGFDTALGSLGAGADGDLWAIKGGIPYHWDVLHNTFDATSGLTGATQIVVGSGAAVFALAGSSPYETVWQWDATSQTWIQLSGNLASIAVGANGTMWGVNASQQIYKLQGAPLRAYQTLNIIQGATVDQISVGADGAVWGVSNLTVEFFNRGTQTFQTVSSPPNIAQVSVGAGNDVWAVTGCPNPNTDGSCPNPADVGIIYEYIAGPSPTWKQIPGELNLVQVGANGDVWGLNAAGQIYYYFFNGASFIQIPGQLGTLSVGADGTVWGINGQLQVYRYNGSTDGSVGSFSNVSGSLAEVSVGNVNNIWGVNAGDQIYTYTGGTFHLINGQLDEVWTSFDGAVWGSNINGTAYRWDASNGFNFAGNNVSYVVVGNAANVWGVNAATGAVYAWF